MAIAKAKSAREGASALRAIRPCAFRGTPTAALELRDGLATDFALMPAEDIECVDPSYARPEEWVE
jgi:hypothetical protein